MKRWLESMRDMGDGHRVVTMRHDQLRECWERFGRDAAAKWVGMDAKWCGGSPADADRILAHGHTDAIDRARAIMDRLTRKLGAKTQGHHLPEPVVCGGRVSVPAYLAGHPAAFRRRTLITANQQAPIRLFVGVSVSAGYSGEMVERRAVACVALAMMAQRQRPVELSFYDYSDRYSDSNVLVVFPVGLSPLDWARCATYAHVLMSRYIGLGLACSALNTASPGLGRYWKTPDKLAPFLGANLAQGDIIVQGMRADTDSDTDAWVERTLQQIEGRAKAAA